MTHRAACGARDRGIYSHSPGGRGKCIDVRLGIYLNGDPVLSSRDTGERLDVVE